VRDDDGFAVLLTLTYTSILPDGT